MDRSNYFDSEIFTRVGNYWLDWLWLMGLEPFYIVLLQFFIKNDSFLDPLTISSWSFSPRTFQIAVR